MSLQNGSDGRAAAKGWQRLVVDRDTPDAPVGGPLRSVSDAVREAAPALWPGLQSSSVRIGVGWQRPRPRCSLTRLDVTDGKQHRSVLVKIRSDEVQQRAGERDGRPRLADARGLTAVEAARLEHSGLSALAEAVQEGQDPRFACVRPLLLLPDQAALVLEYVEQPTLRDELVATSRLRRRPLRVEPWSSAGALLALYHRACPPKDESSRLASPDELEALVQRLLTYLRARRQPADLLRAVEQRAQLLLGAMPGRLRLGVGHGDFTPRNLFVDPTGRVSLFDPMPVWQAPVADDLATFLVALRLSGPQLASSGALFDRDGLAAREDALLTGYGLDPDDPVLSLLVLVALLDRWSWLASVPVAGGARGRVDALKATWLRREVYRECRRLLDAPSGGALRRAAG